MNVRLRVEPYPRPTLITSNLTGLSGRVSCNTRTHKAYVFVTTTLISIKRDMAMRLGSKIDERRFEKMPRATCRAFLCQASGQAKGAADGELAPL